MKSFKLDFLAIFLLLSAPLVNFISYHSYPPFAFEALVCFVAIGFVSVILASAGKIIEGHAFFTRLLRSIAFAAAAIFYTDFQLTLTTLAYAGGFVGAAVFFFVIARHANLVVICFGGLVILSIFVIGEKTPTSPDVKNAVKVQDGDRGLDRPIIHIILDSFIGVGGISDDVDKDGIYRKSISDFFLSRRFVHFPNAFSPSPSTYPGVPYILNFGKPYEQAPAKGQSVFDVDVNNVQYLKNLKEKEYAFYIYQTHYMNYCPRDYAKLFRCFTYLVKSPNLVRDSPASGFERAWMLGSVFLFERRTWSLFLSVYYRVVRIFLSPEQVDQALTTVEIHPQREYVSIFQAFGVFDKLITDLKQAPMKSLFFAHVMAPHTPYVYDSNCTPRRALSWVRPQDEKGGNSALARKNRYQFYLQQLQCTLKIFGGFLDKLSTMEQAADATIIVHGDHGSKIARSFPVSENGTLKGSSQDIRDNYSTLFAFRLGRETKPADDPQLATIDTLLSKLSGNGPSYVMPGCPKKQCILVARVGGRGALVPIPLPEPLYRKDPIKLTPPRFGGGIH